MWYYVENGQQRGPVTESDLGALHQAGTVTFETLVWREGMAEWRPYSEFKSGESVGAPSGGAPLVGGAAVGGVVCAECGKIFPVSEVIRYGNSSVCAGCKPIFIQKLKEGARVGGGLEYAGFGIRLAAKILDGLILGALQIAIGMLAGAVIATTSRGSGANVAAIGLQIALMLGGMLFSVLYSCFFLGKYGATLGKMACKIKVVTPEGGPISYGRGAARPLAEIVSGLICYIGYLMAAWDEEKRALHDRICNTRVVKA